MWQDVFAAHATGRSIASSFLAGAAIEGAGSVYDGVRQRVRAPDAARTTIAVPSGTRGGPWLVSMAMWTTFLRFVGEKGIAVGELERIASSSRLMLAGMERWGYVAVESGAAARRNWMVRLTAAGRKAQQVWLPLPGLIEKRWEDRFGADEIARLCQSLEAVASQFDADPPGYLPVLGYGLFGELSRPGTEPGAQNLPALLSKVLIAFTVEFERDWPLSLAVSANVLRLLDENGVRIRDLPRLSGVSKEGIAMALGFLEKRRLLDGGRTKLVRLNEKGCEARDACLRRIGIIEESWETRFGTAAIGGLRNSLEALTLERLLLGMKPYPDGWRALVPAPATLPQYPMVLQRGGFPDGS